nr:hypothetical protein [Tanacetum cinerariifolium]
MEHVADEAVHKELGENLVRAATTASSLEAEQDNGNINKTQYKATPNEPSSQGTDSGGGPRCQETIKDTIAQTRFKSVSKHSNDSLLERGNTLQSDEDRLELNELMVLCTNLQTRVLNFEKTKTTQSNGIASLKKRVKKLEKKNMLRTYKLKRLYKVSLTARVESSRDEESLVEDASKLGRWIDVIDQDKDITKQEVVKDVNENVVEEVVNAAQDSTAITTITTKEITLAQALEALQTSKPKDKGKGIMIEELVKAKKKDQIRLDEEAAKRKHFTAKRVEEKKNKPPAQAQKKKITCTYLKNMEGYKLKKLKSFEFDKIQEMFDRAFKRVNTFEPIRPELVERKEKIAGEELIQENKKEVEIDVIPLAVKSSRIVDWKIYKEGKKIYYQIVRADGKTQIYMVFSKMLESFNKEDLEDLYKLVKTRYGSTRAVEDLDLLLWGDLKTMFKPLVEDKGWKLQQGYKVLNGKLYDSCGVNLC